MFLYDTERWVMRLIFSILLIYTLSSLTAQFAGGDGTALNPWLIETPQQLNSVRNYLGAGHSNKHFKQNANINLGIPPYNENQGWEAIGLSLTNSFQGTYDGNGYQINNLIIRRNSNYQGLFGYVRNATLKNIIINNAEIRAMSYSGGLAGRADERSTVSNCYVTGNIFPMGNTSYVGGLIGYLSGGSVGRCSFFGVIEGQRWIGGLVGYMLDVPSIIWECYSGGDVTASGSDVGGLVGYATGESISNSYSTSNITGPGNVGGLVGYQGVTCLIGNSYAVGSVNGTAPIGGLIGNGADEATATLSFWNTEYSGQNASFRGTGRTTAQMLQQNTYTQWDFDAIWTINSGSSYPYHRWQENQMPHNIPVARSLNATAGDAAVNLSWQAPFSLVPVNYRIYRNGLFVASVNHPTTNYVDNEVENFITYKYYVTANYAGNRESAPSNIAAALPYAFNGGDGTANNPYRISNAQQLHFIRNFLDSHFLQNEDIDLGVAPYNVGEGWVPIGTNAQESFRGTYDGSYHIINNLTINRQVTRQGLFGYTQGAAIKQVVLTNSDIAGSTQCAALIGEAENSTILRCSVTGSVTGTVSVGLLVGNLRANSTVTNSYSTGRAVATTAMSYVGGLVGVTTDSNITDCYTTATVFGNSTRIGGIVGSNTMGTINRCYAIGQIGGTNVTGEIGGLVGFNNGGTTTNSYWNIETTGVDASAGGGQGRTVLQMLDRDTYPTWNFNQIWNIGYEEEDTYPWFRWQQQPSRYNYPPPIPPLNVWGVAGDGQVSLDWELPTIGEPNAYKIYRNDELLTTIEPALNYLDTTVQNGTRYEYYLIAVYRDIESWASNKVYVTPVDGGYGGGRGTETAPYEIRSEQHFMNVRSNLHVHYLQMVEIDLLPLETWIPIGNEDNPFTGVYDGNGFIIRNIDAFRPTSSFVGLFGSVGGEEGATLKNITVENINSRGWRFVGGLTGRLDEGSSIINCSVQGNAISRSDVNDVYIGGLVGYNNGTIINSNSSGRVEAENKYAGGLVGYHNNGEINGSFSNSNVIGNEFVGGFVGLTRSYIENCYATGSATSTLGKVGGFAGNMLSGEIRYNYSIGQVTAGEQALFIGGFIGQLTEGIIVRCYWNTQTSGYQTSAGGHGRTTAQMTYPYDQTCYVTWDFTDIWMEDVFAAVNEGYPFLYWQPIVSGPNPRTAENPTPSHLAIDVPITLEEVSWTYTDNEYFAEPLGFRVYLNTTNEFGEDDDFVWIPYVQEQENFANSTILPELTYNTVYYWKVVPTTIDPDGRRDGFRDRRVTNNERASQKISLRGDAVNCPVWRFTTAVSSNPDIAANPQPEDRALGISTRLENLRWTYTVNESFTNPLVFRVYLNTTGEFTEEDDYCRVPYVENQTNYNCSDILPDELEYDVTYYWKVVPTTIDPDERRGDAEDVPIWSFTTIDVNSFPQTTVNPDPQHQAVGISLGLDNLSWDYIVSPVHTNPVGFRVYLNTTGAFGSNAPFVWVHYIDEQITYHSYDIITEELDPNTTYYWRVIPTTDFPDELKVSFDRRMLSSRNNTGNSIRGDAIDSPVWRFTTGTTDVAEEQPAVLITKLNHNYPNPFNPWTTISFSTADRGEVTLTVFNSRGESVKTLINDFLEPGEYSIIWQGQDGLNNRLSSGIYFSILKIGNFTAVRKMIMLK